MKAAACGEFWVGCGRSCERTELRGYAALYSVGLSDGLWNSCFLWCKVGMVRRG